MKHKRTTGAASPTLLHERLPVLPTSIPTMRRFMRMYRLIFVLISVALFTSLVLLAALAMLGVRSSRRMSPPQSTQNVSLILDFTCGADVNYTTYRDDPHLSEIQVMRMLGRDVILGGPLSDEWLPYVADYENKGSNERRNEASSNRFSGKQKWKGERIIQEGDIVDGKVVYRRDSLNEGFGMGSNAGVKVNVEMKENLNNEQMDYNGAKDPPGKAEEKMMEWHGFGKSGHDEDNSENAWKNSDAQFSNWRNFRHDAIINLINYTAVVLEPFKPEPDFSYSPRITYLNGHRGCNENLRGVMSKFRLNFNVVDPRKISKYGMFENDARYLVNNGWVQALCGVSDIIIVADTVPDARALFLFLLDPDPKKRCQSKIVIEMTNRFNWEIHDNEFYYPMMRKLALNPPKNLWWTANNPFEAVFFANQVGVAPNITLLRSLGAWDVDSQIKTTKTIASKLLEALGLNWSELRYRKEIDEVARESLCTIQDVETTTRPKVGDLFDYYCLPIVQLSKKYGGPVGLLKFKAFLYIPYQVSVMKFYENVAMGVPQILPTPRLLRVMGKTNNHHLFCTWMDKLEEASLFMYNPVWHKRVYNADHSVKDRKDWDNIDAPYHATWTEYVDFYRSEFEPFVYYFDSFAELAELIKRPAEVFDWKNVRVEGPRYYTKVRKETSRPEWHQSPLATYRMDGPHNADEHSSARAGDMEVEITQIDDAPNIPKSVLDNSKQPSNAFPVPPFDRSASETRTRNAFVSTRVDLTAGVFVAGSDGEVTGRLVLSCKKHARQVKIGAVAVHLSGFEHVLSHADKRRVFASSARTANNTRLFMHSALNLQSNTSAPSEAVLPGPCDEDGMWAARPGTTVFDFAVKLCPEAKGANARLPSSFWNSRSGGVRYILAATVQVKIGFNRPHVLVVYQEAQVVESVGPPMLPTMVPSLTLWGQDRRMIGWLESRKGEVFLKARCHVREFDIEDTALAVNDCGAWISGGVGHVFVEVNNGSLRKVKHLKLSLIRRLKTFSLTNAESGSLIPINFSRDIVTEKLYRSSKPKFSERGLLAKPAPQWEESCGNKSKACVEEDWPGVKRGESFSFLASIDVPANIRSVRYGLLVEVSYAIQVTAIPKGSAGVSVEIPITILHPLSVLESGPSISRLSKYKTLPLKNEAVLQLEVPASNVPQIVIHEEIQVSEGLVIQDAELPRAGIITPRSATLNGKPVTISKPLAARSKSDAKVPHIPSTNYPPITSMSSKSDALGELDSLAASLRNVSLGLTPPKRKPPSPPFSRAKLARNLEHESIPKKEMMKQGTQGDERHDRAFQRFATNKTAPPVTHGVSQDTLVTNEGGTLADEFAEGIDAILSQKLVERQLLQRREESAAVTRDIDALFEKLDGMD
ncbi:hypothetical protein CcCBS67573_g07777 [Chytriomyces confervae]|uniref:Arrestin C-terminal-like domain-containing protein n=1 Tax=Chytriomyces confervae TaxID=246404 RepID=A0A507ERR6_9FUNG|nr:hypothetical protein CcCBS67573_g07777 [Chytriomyces confervae]